MFKKFRILETIAISLLVLAFLPCRVLAKSPENISENTVDGMIEETEEAVTSRENAADEEEGKEVIQTFTWETVSEYITDEEVLLPESASEARAAIVAGLKSHVDYIDLSPYGITYNEFYTILYKDILYWDGSLFYVAGGSSGGRGDYVTYYRPRYIENEAAVASALKRAVRDSITSDMNDFQKALALHNWLAMHCSYDHAGLASGNAKYTAYDALVTGSAVCQGYTDAYTMLTRYAGLEVGTASGGNHTWNQVKIDGQWYNVDVTWDGQEGYGDVSYSNFMISDSKLIRNNHTIANQDNSCTSTLYDDGRWWGKNAARRTDSAVVPINGSEAYAVSYDGSSMKLLHIDMATGAESVVHTFKNTVKWGSKWYASCVLLRTGGRTYLNDTKNIYQIEDNGSVSILWTYKGTDGRLIYSMREKDGSLMALVGNSASDVRAENVSLPESVIPDVTSFVKRLYTVCLGRDYDAAGLNDWVSRLDSHQETAAQVAYGFFFSDEFKMKDLSDQEYVEILYQTMFDRAGDAAGVNDWLDKLENGMSRLYVYRGFAESQEFSQLCDRFDVTRGSISLSAYRDRNVGATGFIARLYTKMLGREFDDDGLEYWCRKYLTGENTIEEVAAHGFLHSQELINQNLSDREFVTRMYRTFLNREPDQAGLEDWMNRLRTGEVNRDTLVYGFTLSREFGEIKASYGLN